MFGQEIDIPMAVASYDDEGVEDAIGWCIEHLTDGEILTVWTHLKSNLEHCEALETLVKKYSNVEHMAARGKQPLLANGVVLMAWADVSDISELLRIGRNKISAVCVISWKQEDLAPWVAAQKPEILGNGDTWEQQAYELNPVVVEELERLTIAINHNNTISGGYEKDQVISTLTALHKAGALPEGTTLKGWAVANGWTGKNPHRLSTFADDIKAGKRPRANYCLRDDYISDLKKRLERTNSD